MLKDPYSLNVRKQAVFKKRLEQILSLNDELQEAECQQNNSILGFHSLNPDGHKVPVFSLDPVMVLFRHLDTERPIYFTNNIPFPMQTEGTIPNTVNIIVSNIRKISPDGPYNILAFCGVSKIAYLVACELFKTNTDTHLFLLEPPSVLPSKWATEMPEATWPEKLKMLQLTCLAFVFHLKRILFSLLKWYHFDKRVFGQYALMKMERYLSLGARFLAFFKFFSRHENKNLQKPEKKTWLRGFTGETFTYFPGSLSLILCPSMPHTMSLQMNWKSYVKSCKLHVIDATHLEILRLPHVEKIVKILQEGFF